MKTILRIFTTQELNVKLGAACSLLHLHLGSRWEPGLAQPWIGAACSILSGWDGGGFQFKGGGFQFDLVCPCLPRMWTTLNCFLLTKVEWKADHPFPCHAPSCVSPMPGSAGLLTWQSPYVLWCLLLIRIFLLYDKCSSIASPTRNAPVTLGVFTSLCDSLSRAAKLPDKRMWGLDLPDCLEGALKVKCPN